MIFSEFPKQSYVGFGTSNDSFFLGHEIPKVNTFAVLNNTSLPLSLSMFFVFISNASMTRLVIYQSFSIDAVLRVIAFSKVANSIIRLIAVDMVNYLFRPSSIDIKPRKAVGLVKPIVNTDNNIASIFKACSFTTAEAATPSASMLPSKYSSFLVVVNQLFEAILRKRKSPLITVGHLYPPGLEWVTLSQKLGLNSRWAF